MPSRARGIAICLTAVLLAAAWAMTLDGFFDSPDILKWSDPSRADGLAESHDASWENVSIRAADGVTLRGWLFRPRNYRGRSALLVHAGLGNRHDMLSRAGALLDRGYGCLLVDQRGCGTSGGRVSWGVKEPGDIAAWAQWLHERTASGEVFGWGLSRGSTTLLQSLALGAPFTGVAAEASGAGNIGQPYQFLSDKTHMSERKARMLWWPVIEPSFWWIHQRFGSDMKTVRDGLAAVRGSRADVLLIHGSEDRGAALAGVERLRDANPRHAELVVIRGADHEWFSPGRPEVVGRVVAWFERR